MPQIEAQTDKKTRLSREDWILAGFRALCKSGSSGLKAEALARDLKTTKGSFYWHFKDVADYEQAMLIYWRAKATDEIISMVAQKVISPKDELRALIDIVTAQRDDSYGGLAVESAIRTWANTNAQVARVRRDVDIARLGYLRERFALVGFSQERSSDFSRIIYAALMGLEYLEMQSLSSSRKDLSVLLEILLGLDKN